MRITFTLDEMERLGRTLALVFQKKKTSHFGFLGKNPKVEKNLNSDNFTR